jgi:hypothetical protein
MIFTRFCDIPPLFGAAEEEGVEELTLQQRITKLKFSFPPSRK